MWRNLHQRKWDFLNISLFLCIFIAVWQLQPEVSTSQLHAAHAYISLPADLAIKAHQVELHQLSLSIAPDTPLKTKDQDLKVASLVIHNPDQQKDVRSEAKPIEATPTPTPQPSATPRMETEDSIESSASAKEETIIVPVEPVVELMPTPTLTPEPTPVSRPVSISSEHDATYQRFASEFNIDVTTLTLIAQCESRHNAGATNGDYGGLYQFSSSTWQSTRTSMGLDPNPELRFNPEEAIRTAAFKIAAGGVRAWYNCAKFAQAL